MKSLSRKGKIVLLGVTLLIVAGIITIAVTASGSSPEKRLEKQLSLGERYLSEMEYEKAIVAYEKAIEIDPKNVDAYIGLAEAYAESGNEEKAREVLEEALKGDWSKQNMEKLTQALQQCIQIKPTTTPEPTLTPSGSTMLGAADSPSPTSLLNEAIMSENDENKYIIDAHKHALENNYKLAYEIINEGIELLGEKEKLIKKREQIVNGYSYGKGEGSTIENRINGGNKVNCCGTEYYLYYGTYINDGDYLKNVPFGDEYGLIHWNDLTGTFPENVSTGIGKSYTDEFTYQSSGNWIYGLMENKNHHYIYKLNVITGEGQLIYSLLLNDEYDTRISSFFISNEFIFVSLYGGKWYENLDYDIKKNIIRMDLNGKNQTQITAYQEAQILFVEGGWIYYSEGCKADKIPETYLFSLYDDEWAWGSIFMMDYNGEHITQVTDKAGEDEIYYQHVKSIYGDDGVSRDSICIGYDFAFLTDNYIYCLSNTTDYYGYVMFQYNLVTHEREIIYDFFDYKNESGSGAATPKFLMKDGDIWITFIEMYDKVVGTCTFNTRTGIISQSSEIQRKIADLYLQDYWITIMNNRCYYYVETGGKRNLFSMRLVDGFVEEAVWILE